MTPLPGDRNGLVPDAGEEAPGPCGLICRDVRAAGISCAVSARGTGAGQRPHTTS